MITNWAVEAGGTKWVRASVAERGEALARRVSTGTPPEILAGAMARAAAAGEPVGEIEGTR